MFFTESQEGFGTCKLGESEGNFGLDEEEQDADEVELIPADEDEEQLRTSTPIPEIPPPKHFETLSIDEQFEYVKPILTAILQERYEPARARHDAFMRSAASRQHVVDQNHESGQLKGYELEQLGPLIRRWIRRRQARQQLGLIPSHALPDGDEEILLSHSPPPPSTIGSDDYVPPGAEIFSDDGAATDPLSEASMPPSSFESAVDREELSAPRSSQLNAVELTTAAIDEDLTARPDVTNAFNMDKTPQAPSDFRGPSKSFASLTEIDQLTYCSSILLQEAKYQLLLWRHGLRHSLELLSPAEEKKLHEQAKAKAGEMDWVHAIILSRRAAEKSMLPTYRGQAKPLTRLRSGRD